MEEIRVHVVKYPDRDNLVMRYCCPLTGKQVSRSTGTNRRREAEKTAAKWEAELQEGRYQRDARMGWDEFRVFWEQSRLPSLKPESACKYASTFNAFESLCRPAKIADLTTTRVTTFAAELRSKGLAEPSVAKHLRHLKAIARWAHRQSLLVKVPEFEMPNRAAVAKMKGRPITGEEFDRLLDSVPSVVGDDAAESWQHLLRGLWWSGLRLGEALALRWEQTPGGVWAMLDGRRSVLAFDAGSQKSGKVELVPLAPEAVELLEPCRQSRGYVFRPHRLDGGGPMARDSNKASRLIGRIGRAAGVVVDVESGKTATAHDLRRAFGSRWARRVMPAELKALMRHASIETTMTYYVEQNAQATAASLWDSLGTNRGTNERAGSGKEKTANIESVVCKALSE